MILLPADAYPIPFNPTWEQTDSTKMKCAMRCLRRYFWEYVAGWRVDAAGESLHLVFGSAWHLAMEHLLKNLNHDRCYSPSAVEQAFSLFNDYYRSHFDESLDEENSPKNPANALAALIEYSERYNGDASQMEVLYTEITGTVPISEDRRMVFKIDAVCRDRDSNLNFVLEHKTTTAMTKNWADQWILSIQTGTYCHALHCLMSSDKVYGAKVNGAFLRKKGNDFMRVPVQKNPASMQQWLETANYWYDQIEDNFQRLAEAKLGDSIMLAFPMNTEACMDFGQTCPYHDLCYSWNNPLQRVVEGPIGGFKTDFWNPMEEHLKTAKLIDIEGGLDVN